MANVFTTVIEFIAKFTGKQQLGSLKDTIQRLQNVVNRTEQKVQKLTKSFRDNVLSAKRFKMEYLSIMFAGMALAGVFGQYINEAQNMLGITDMLNISFTMFVVQALTPFLDMIYSVLGAFLSLPTPVQQAIGMFMLLVTALGSFMAIAGAIILALSGIALALTAMGFTISLVGAAILVGWVIAILAIIAVIWSLWTNWDKVWAMIVEFTKGASKVIGDIAGSIVDIIIGIYTKLKSLLPTSIQDVLTLIENFFKDLLKKAYDFGVNIVTNIIDGIKSIGSQIKSSLDKYMPAANMITNTIAGAGAFGPAGMLVSAGKKILGYADGGVVGGPIGAPVPAIVHGGETVIPAGSSGISFSPNISIIVNASSGLDLDTITDKLSREWVDKLNSMIRSR